MHIAIIGAGFTGLSAAWELVKKKVEITVFESDSYPGGLASGFKDSQWHWSLERHYHHLFESDKHMQGLISQMGLNHALLYKQTKTTSLFQNKLYQLDSTSSLIKFTPLPLISRLRMGATLAFLRLNPYWQLLDSVTAREFIISYMGKKSWETLWQPLFKGKFGRYSDIVTASWFWSRIHVRSKRLGYPIGGFAALAEKMVSKLKDKNVKFLLNHQITAIRPSFSQFHIELADTKNKYKPSKKFDKVIITAPSPIVKKIIRNLPPSYEEKLDSLKGLGVITQILELNKPFFSDNTYWLNISQLNWPFVAVVDHGNFMDIKHYANRHLVYIGKYLSPDEKQFSLTSNQLLSLYHPYLNKLSPGYKKHLLRHWTYKAHFAQPVPPKNHRLHLPSFDTPIANIYWASMQHVYPYDRGTNYAVGLGAKVAKHCLNH